MSLTQQLEDKKKGCGLEINQNNYINRTILRCSEKTEYCPKCKEIISILEQAIAEIKSLENGIEQVKQVAKLEGKLEARQEILDKIDKVIPTNWLDNKLSIFYGDKTFDERKIERLLLGIKQELKEQLNQPKTEQ